MTSLRQIEANRDNALKSTGPRTQTGKQRSRRNALSHGFTAETVLEPLEDPENYQAFERGLSAEYLPQRPVEKSLSTALRRYFGACTGNIDRNWPFASAERNPPWVPQLPPEDHRKANRGGCRKSRHVPRRRSRGRAKSSGPSGRISRDATGRPGGARHCGRTWTARSWIGSVDTNQASGVSRATALCPADAKAPVRLGAPPRPSGFASSKIVPSLPSLLAGTHFAKRSRSQRANPSPP
jgi:hypothetical protein